MWVITVSGKLPVGLLVQTRVLWILLLLGILPTLSFDVVSFPCYQQQSGMRLFAVFPSADSERFREQILPKPFPECFILFLFF